MKIHRSFSFTVRRALPWPPKVFLQIIRQSGFANLIDSHASLQSSHGCTCKLNTVAWVVELTYLDVIVKFERLLGGHGKARCTVNSVNGFAKRLVLKQRLTTTWRLASEESLISIGRAR